MVSEPRGAYADAAKPELFYKNLVSFVQEHLAPSYGRSLSGTDRTWCPSWWKHEEAISRLETLWRSWEFLRLDGSTGMSIWWRDHAVHHMGVLLSADGPFKGCKPVTGGHATNSSKLSRVSGPRRTLLKIAGFPYQTVGP
ncbi:DUF4913 domain-containing protein [Pseudarthrobacter sp. BRE9]|uniref:DUF4913 domain-containing protein n=1 Tax=Pseudarthrobacter sp. BRE9 TaxID=2962582 RepID=UPI002881A036|nr:DUF4913 domain-containing protein [Pseudarthrobacter sp. BRE9]MDT0168440.1 DUF4913 domain-containing protein [Pseudarthrobacter sp. BRE9]